MLASVLCLRNILISPTLFDMVRVGKLQPFPRYELLLLPAVSQNVIRSRVFSTMRTNRPVLDLAMPSGPTIRILAAPGFLCPPAISEGESASGVPKVGGVSGLPRN